MAIYDKDLSNKFVTDLLFKVVSKQTEKNSFKLSELIPCM